MPGSPPATPPASPTPPPPAGAPGSPAPAPSGGTAATDALRQLATTLAAPTPVIPQIIKAKVTAISSTAPPTVTVLLGGDTLTPIPGVQYNDAYAPVVNDIVLVAKQGADLFVLCQLALTFSESLWTTPTLASGFSQGANGNGNLQYRLIIENGAKKIAWQGSVTQTTGTTICTVPAAYAPSVKRSMGIQTDVGAVQVDFNTDGTVVYTAPTGVTGSTSGGTTGSGGNDTNSTSIGNTGTTGGSTSNDSIGNTDLGNGGSGVGAHYHSMGSHGHSGPNHFHSMGSHNHTVNNHTHSEGSHTHSLPTNVTNMYFNGVSYYV